MGTVATPNFVLKDAIFRKGMRQTQVAEKARIHESRLSKIVRGWVEPSDDEKARIAKALKASVADLFHVAA